MPNTTVRPMYVGLAVHKDTIAVALADDDRCEARLFDTIVNTAAARPRMPRHRPFAHTVQARQRARAPAVDRMRPVVSASGGADRPRNLAVAVIAREPCTFIWAIGQAVAQARARTVPDAMAGAA